MSETAKPGFLSRWFGRKEEAPAATPAETPAETTAETPAPSPASEAEGRPDFAPVEIPPAPADVTEASPDRAVPDLPPDLAGADLQPIEPAERAPTKIAPASLEPEPAEPSIQPQDAAAALAADATAGERGWWRRLTDGMRRTSASLTERVTSLFTKAKLDAGTLEDLEDALIQADFGIETASRVSEAVGKGRYEKGIAPDEVRAILAAEVERVLTPVAVPLAVDASQKPFVVLMVGVNGAGKTTTIGKLAQKFRAQGRSVMLAAGDTFRAAAIEQLGVWGERTGAKVVSRPQGADAAGLAHDAVTEARAAGTDVLLIDTAGRLQNKTGLMSELEKIVRVVKKLDPSAPHAVLLVLDATVGQNAMSQVELFGKAAGVTGLVMTKLDGTARGGILVALAARFALPVHFIGVGEGVEDLEPFAARDFARAIVGLAPN